MQEAIIDLCHSGGREGRVHRQEDQQTRRRTYQVQRSDEEDERRALEGSTQHVSFKARERHNVVNIANIWSYSFPFECRTW